MFFGNYHAICTLLRTLNICVSTDTFSECKYYTLSYILPNLFERLKGWNVKKVNDFKILIELYHPNSMMI